MLDVQIGGRGVTDADVLGAMREVPRERFVDSDLAEFAYKDSPLPIPEGQTISQPYLVAAMIEPVQIRAADQVLEIDGRLAIPVGDTERSQRLIKVTKRGADRYVQENLGEVTFVPLIGVEGWSEARDPNDLRSSRRR